MTDCRAYEALIEKYLATEISPAETAALRAHCAECPDCRAVLDLHRRLELSAEDIPEPSAAELAAMRRRVMAGVGVQSRQGGWRHAAGDLLSLFRAQPVAVPALLAAILIVGVLAGRWSAAPSGNRGDPLLRADSSRALAEAVERMAERNARQAALQPDLDTFWDAPYLFANVAVRSRDDGDLDLSFDVCRHVDLVASPESPLAREVLLSTILTSTSLGARLNAVSLSPQLADTRLRAALIHAMHGDPDLAVRLKALEVLSAHTDAAEVRSALLGTLRDDEAVQMRLLALESLTSGRVDPQLIRQAIEAVAQESDAAVLRHAVQLKEDL